MVELHNGNMIFLPILSMSYFNLIFVRKVKLNLVRRIINNYKRLYYAWSNKKHISFCHNIYCLFVILELCKRNRLKSKKISRKKVTSFTTRNLVVCKENCTVYHMHTRWRIVLVAVLYCDRKDYMNDTYLLLS